MNGHRDFPPIQKLVLGKYRGQVHPKVTEIREFFYEKIGKNVDYEENHRKIKARREVLYRKDYLEEHAEADYIIINTHYCERIGHILLNECEEFDTDRKVNDVLEDLPMYVSIDKKKYQAFCKDYKLAKIKPEAEFIEAVLRKIEPISNPKRAGLHGNVIFKGGNIHFHMDTLKLLDYCAGIDMISIFEYYYIECKGKTLIYVRLETESG